MYIDELIYETKILSLSGSPLLEKIVFIMRNYCISVILKSNDYPIAGKLNTLYTVFGTIINLTASIVTILGYQNNLIPNQVWHMLVASFSQQIK